MIEKAMMKWRFKRCNSDDHEDVRRSLNILDSVLAQFDEDGDLSFFESGDPSREDEELEQQAVVIRNKTDGEAQSKSLESYQSSPRAITCLPSYLDDEWRRYSPPPVPKRSPRTRLSYKHKGNDYPLSSDLELAKRLKTNSTGNLCDILSNRDAPSRLSDTGLIRTWRDTTPRNDNIVTNNVALERKPCQHCGKMDPSLERSPSVAQRRRHFESPDLSQNRHRYLKKNNSLGLLQNRLQNALSDSKLDQIGLREEEEPFQSLPVSPTLDKENNWNDIYEGRSERLRKLDRKFAKVRRMLKAKEILPLEDDPPDFEPPPLEPIEDEHENEEFMCDRCKARKSKLKESGMDKSGGQGGHKLGTPIIHTIENLRSLIPTDTLNMPQYGLDCSMEEDLSPGVKDILTSTPKRDKLHLSTFSQSVSSLGYGSCQSDLDLSYKDTPGKLPVSSLKSQTLPMGLRLVPPPPYPDTFLTDTDSLDSSDLHRSFDLSNPDEERSNSAPPLKHLQRAEKKYVFGMSRKEKKSKDRNDDDEISVKSSQSAEPKFRTSDVFNESKSLKNGSGKVAPTEEKYKRKSVWKSILRRK